MQRKIGFQYTFTDKNLGELGRQYGELSRENSRQLNHRFWDNIHSNLPPELQTRYPRKTIPDRKPLGQKSRERLSEAHGGLSLRVRDLVQKGVTDPKQIRNTLGISTEALARARIVLNGWGIDIPRTTKSNIKEAFERIKTEKDDEKLQEFLDSFSAGSLIDFLQRDFKHKTLTTASAIANEQGFHAYTTRVRFIAETIKEAKIPIRYTKRFRKNGKLLGFYYIVYTKHSKRIAEALRNDPALQRFR